MKKIAYYTLSVKNELCVIIPKKRGNGFCKSVFGFHSTNKNSNNFFKIAPKWFVDGDFCDLDGLLSIKINLSPFDEKFQEGVNLTIQALQIVFPHVEKFEENDTAFWNALK